MDNLDNKEEAQSLKEKRQSYEQDAEWNALKEKRYAKSDAQKSSRETFSGATKAKIGFGLGAAAIAAAVFGMVLNVIFVAVGIFYSVGGRKSELRNLATIGLVLNIVGVLIWCWAVFAPGLLG